MKTNMGGKRCAPSMQVPVSCMGELVVCRDSKPDSEMVFAMLRH